MNEPNEDNTKRIFERLSLVTAGEPGLDALAAVQDLYCAMICAMTPDKVGAMKLARLAHDDINGTINKHFDWYHSHGLQSVNQPAARSR